MQAYKVKFDFVKAQPVWTQERINLFGEHNEGFTIIGHNPRGALEEWNSNQLPGKRLNPFYVTVKEIT